MESSVLSFLENSNVLVFDTETTGLPQKAPGGWGSYWEFNLNDKYESSRIVSIAWSFISKFNKNNIDSSSIEHFIRYPEGFQEISTTHIHGISMQDALQKGTPFGLILHNGKLGKAILDAEYLVAHNVGFDYHILILMI